MFTLAAKLRMAAATLAMMAVLCIPLPATNPKAAASAFHALKTTGSFVYRGLGALTVALVLLIISFLVRR